MQDNRRVTYGTLWEESVTAVPWMLIAEDLGPRGILWQIFGCMDYSAETFAVREQHQKSDLGNSRELSSWCAQSSESVTLFHPPKHHIKMPSEDTKVSCHRISLFYHSFELSSGTYQQGCRDWTCTSFRCCSCSFTYGSGVPQTILHYGWIPLIIYVGFTRSNPKPELFKYVALQFHCLGTR